jgi:hypothetical protein
MNPTSRLMLSSSLLAGLCVPMLAHATAVVLPEPGTWSLVALGLAAAVVASIRKRRK